MKLLHGRVAPLAAGLTLLVATTACTRQSPASTPQGSTPAVLFHHATVAQAWQTAQTARRPLVVMFTSEHCPHCERMLSETYGHPEIQRFLNAHAETALAHATTNRELVQRLGIRGFPTTVIVSAQGQIVDVVEGYVDPATFAQHIVKWMGPGAQAGAQLTPVAAR